MSSQHHVEELLDISNVRCHVDALSRKRVLQEIAKLVADEHIGADALFDGLMARERLGSTGLGDGVAIPHCRIASAQMRIAFVSLPNPIDYEAADGEPVDLLFVLVVPEEEQQAHLQALSLLAQIFSNPTNLAALRACNTDHELHQVMHAQLAQQVLDT